LLTVRACWWAINQLRREHASVAGLTRQLGTTWRTVWRSIKPLLEAMAADPTRFENVTTGRRSALPTGGCNDVDPGPLDLLAFCEKAPGRLPAVLLAVRRGYAAPQATRRA